MSDPSPVEPVETIDAPTVPAAASPAEEYTLLPDGRILFAFEGKRWHLRRPLFGEFKVFRTQFLALANLAGDAQMDAAVEFVQAVFEVLADRPLAVEADQWPTWLVMGMPYGDWVTHWRDVPLGPGGPTGPAT